MSRKEMMFCSGCWSAPMVSALLVVFLIPLFAHGNTVVGNETEADSALNVTSLSTEGEEEKLKEVSSATYLTQGSEQKEEGSGMLEEVISPTPGTSKMATTSLPGPEISPDSAETDHLLPHDPDNKFTKDQKHEEEKVTPDVPTQPPWQAKRDMETTVFDLDHEDHESPTTPPPTPPPSPSDVTVDFFDSGSSHKNLEPPSLSPHELQGGDPTSWDMPEDYTTPYDDSVSPTTEDYPYSSTTDSYDDDLTTTPSSEPIHPRLSFNPDNTQTKWSNAVEESPVPPDVGDSVYGSDCRQGFVRSNGTCKSPCNLQPSFCFNGGQCYVLEGTQMFCRCNIQDYMWHKGARCESVITEFQVMCIAIGATALMVLLLFMIIVCFAKKLHVLKTENQKLRKRSSKYRPSSEHHNDNFSLSTIAEGSHPNVRKLCDTPPNLPHARALAYYDNIICQDDPNAQNKLEDPVKAPPPKEDESLNIQNSLTPKHENHKVLGEENSSEGRMTIDVELHLPKRAKVLPKPNPLVHYDVFLYKVAKSQERVKHRVRWEDCEYSVYESPFSCCPAYSPVSTRSLPAIINRTGPCKGMPCTPSVPFKKSFGQA
ncbi:chondroitin sulfate proteoglycan 5-like isoform X3 [Xyrauchen texanus]|uniref:chondroitin sulfate proteoglycan 5-like isoform X3 n=1 Tax=Xyrauchen texanus TaxID=154827 RepID=UPI0022420FF5|nr:chondroitin sulfate proteoglycan 5-like isoform X3 [Xyrauchen texanus]